MQASNTAVLDGNSENDFGKIQDEIDTLKREYVRIGTDTEFNKKKLLDGSYQDQKLQVGANAGQQIEISIDATNWSLKNFVLSGTGELANDYKISQKYNDCFTDQTKWKVSGDYKLSTTAENVKSGNGAAISNLIKEVDTMIESVTNERSKLGAIQNRLEYTVKVDDNTAENLQSAESRIRDTDMADEMTRFSKESILQQAATSMLAQANQANQGVLSLLQ